jgi:Tol biopolymer transport system component
MNLLLMLIALALLVAVAAGAAEHPIFPAGGDEVARPAGLIGYTEFRTNLPEGRWANVATMRAHVVRADRTGRRMVGSELVNEPHVWTQFAGWSPDGKTAILCRGWNDPENGRWEEEHRQFRMEEGKWLLDSYLLDVATGQLTNVTAVERVSHYNGGLFFLPGGRKLGFTPLINGVSKPYVMDLDGRNKQDVSGGTGGFTYGYSASPDGQFISYHEDYQVYIAHADGSGKKRVETGNPFNFAPRWSPDGEWVLFVSGEHGRSNPYLVRRDGAGLRKLADLNGYQGWVLFLDVYDHHQGSSDVPSWGGDGPWVYFTAQVGEGTTEILRVSVDGKLEQLTHSQPGTLNYQPVPSPDGKWACFGSNRTGTRQLYVMSAEGKVVYPITDVPPGWGALWPHWQPVELGAGPGRE